MVDLVNILVDSKEVLKHITELSEDPSRIERLVNEQIIDVIKEMHPNDYKSFIERNRIKLEDIKQRFRTNYSLGIKHRISGLFGIYE